MEVPDDADDVDGVTPLLISQQARFPDYEDMGLERKDPGASEKVGRCRTERGWLTPTRQAGGGCDRSVLTVQRTPHLSSTVSTQPRTGAGSPATLSIPMVRSPRSVAPSHRAE